MPLWKWASEGLSGDKGGYCLDWDLDQKSPGVFSSGAVDILKNWTWSAISNTHWHSSKRTCSSGDISYTLYQQLVCLARSVALNNENFVFIYRPSSHWQTHPTYKPICCSMLLSARKAYGWKGGTSDCIAWDVHCHHCGICIFNSKTSKYEFKEPLEFIAFGHTSKNPERSEVTITIMAVCWHDHKWL